VVEDEIPDEFFPGRETTTTDEVGGVMEAFRGVGSTRLFEVEFELFEYIF
jgi:hypothetical protein